MKMGGGIIDSNAFKFIYKGRHVRDRMLVGFTTTCAMSA